MTTAKPSIALVLLTAFLAACAATQRSPSASSHRRAQATPTAGHNTETLSAAATPPVFAGRPPSQELDERSIGEAAELPLPEGPVATPGPNVQAAVRPPAEVATTETKNTAAAEPESLLGRIGPSTPPNVAAAIRLVEDARQQMQQGRYDQAIDRLERAVAIDPTNAYGYYFLAQLHYHNKQYDQAIAFASRAAVLSARTDRIWLARVYSFEGSVYEEVGRYPEARKAYEQAVNADPNNQAARVGKARLSASQ